MKDLLCIGVWFSIVYNFNKHFNLKSNFCLIIKIGFFSKLKIQIIWNRIIFNNVTYKQNSISTYSNLI